MKEAGRLGEVLGILAMAADLGTGLPMEHAIRACLLSVELGRRIGLSGAELTDLYDLTLLRMVGCTAGAEASAEYFGDEVAFGTATQHLDYGDPQGFGRWVMESFAIDRPRAEREAMLQKLFSYTSEARREALAGHCEVAQMLAARLGFSGAVLQGLGMVFERWDGTGAPNQIAGADQPVAVRVMTLCNELETHDRLGGEAAAVAMARERAGCAFEPALVEAFCADATAILAVAHGLSSWDRLLDAEPAPQRHIDETRLVEAARVMGDFVDMKSLYFTGHSSGVAAIAAAAAERAGLGMAERRDIQIAGLAQDLGRVTVSTSVWVKPKPLTDREWEAVRLHAYYSERMLGRAPSFAGAARLAGLHHERMNGSGYHRGSAAALQPEASRLLAAADVYVAMRQPRPHREALYPDRAGAELHRLAAEDELDAGAVNAVLEAAGDTRPALRRRWPADLTDREVDVLRQIAGGASIQAAASTLRVAPKTVDFHLQNISRKHRFPRAPRRRSSPFRTALSSSSGKPGELPVRAPQPQP